LAASLELWLTTYGPWLIFVMAILETCFITGLVVPSGLATAVGTVLATQGELSLQQVVMAALAGGWLGDALGYWVGRASGEALLHGDHRLARMAAPHHERVNRFLGRHPVYSVTVARWVSFVRTLMPMAAGMSGIRFGIYLMYELPGLVGWVALYVAVGFLAGESWEVVTQIIGVGGTAAFAGAGVVFWWILRRKGSDRSPSPSASDG